jgi:ParB family chromosome partitioning protein
MDKISVIVPVYMEAVPCFFCDSIVEGDEVKFNQLHNLTDTRDCISSGDAPVLGFQQVNANGFTINDNRATELQEICKLITKYGNLLCAVLCAGRILIGARYIKACQLLRLPVNLYNIEAAHYEMAAKYLSDDYGVYNYDKLEKHTYVQGLAQMFRSVEVMDGKKQNASTLYTHIVLPYLQKTPGVSVLDFGCGKGAYITAVRKSGHPAVGVEFYNNNGSQIDVAMGNAQIDTLVRAIQRDGLFDVVVCDSVLNSVDSMEAEEAVLKCLNVFSKGKVFVSGRPIDNIISKSKLKRRLDKSALQGNMNAFLDANNFTATYRKGNWYYQHYHTRETIKAAVERAGLRIDKLHWGGNSFQVECSKMRELSSVEVKTAIDFEFTLPLPNGKRYARNIEVLSVLSLLLSSEIVE